MFDYEWLYFGLSYAYRAELEAHFPAFRLQCWHLNPRNQRVLHDLPLIVLN